MIAAIIPSALVRLRDVQSQLRHTGFLCARSVQPRRPQQQRLPPPALRAAILTMATIVFNLSKDQCGMSYPLPSSAFLRLLRRANAVVLAGFPQSRENLARKPPNCCRSMSVIVKPETLFDRWQARQVGSHQFAGKSFRILTSISRRTKAHLRCRGKRTSWFAALSKPRICVHQSL